MTKDAVLARVMKRPKESGHGRRTEAYVWLRIRYEKLSPRLRKKPGWRGLAEDMTAGGIKSVDGKPLTGHSVMRIWSRVCQDVATEEPWRTDAVRAAMQHGTTMQKPRSREPERGANADRLPPVVTTPAPRPSVPYYPPPTLPPPKPLMQPAIASRPHEELSEEEREAYAKAQILRLRRRFAEASGHNPDDIK